MLWICRMWRLFFVLRRLTTGASRLSSVIRRSETNRTLFRRSFSPAGSATREWILAPGTTEALRDAMPFPRSVIRFLVFSFRFPHFGMILATVMSVLSWPFSWLIVFLLIRTFSLIFVFTIFFGFQGKFLHPFYFIFTHFHFFYSLHLSLAKWILRPMSNVTTSLKLD